jgi:FkbM family methyltransferase
MTFVSYAQNFEDVLLWRVFRDVESGKYIDIGAQDPVMDSVSLAFYEAGWRGTHVEPVPSYAARLREARPDETVIQAAVSDIAGPLTFFELGGLSSGRPDIAEHHSKSGHKPQEILVPTIRLEELLATEKDDVHWLKIDVEGMEAEVLRSWGSSKKRPMALIVEATFPNSEETTEHLWIDEVLSRGYTEVFFDGLSRYFIHEQHVELGERLNRPANVFDGYQITLQHFSATSMRDAADTERAASEARENALHDKIAESLARVREFEARHASALAERAKLVQASVVEAAEARERLESLEIELTVANANIQSERNARVDADGELLKISRLAGAFPSDFSLATKTEHSVQPGSTFAAIQARLGHAAEELDRARDYASQQFVAGQASRQPEISFLHQQITSLQRDVTESRVFAERQFISGQNSREQEVVLLNQRISSLKTDVENMRTGAEQSEAQLRAVLEEHSAALSSERSDVSELSRQIEEAEQFIAAIYASRRGRFARWFALLPPRRSAKSATFITRRPSSLTEKSQPTVSAQRHALETAVQDMRHTSNLLTLNGTLFVESLYRTFLKRSADRAGRDHFIGRLQAGHSKEEILLAIAKSPEARQVGTKIDGLEDLERARTRDRGWFFDRKSARLLEARLSRLEYVLGEAHNSVIDRLDRIETSLDQIKSQGGRGALRFDTSQTQASATGEKNVKSIKRGISIDAPSSAPEFIRGLRREVQSSAEALTLRRS